MVKKTVFVLGAHVPYGFSKGEGLLLRGTSDLPAFLGSELLLELDVLPFEVPQALHIH